MYSAEYYTKQQFPLLQKDWETLQKGIEMTSYQSYAWYNMLNTVYVPNDTNNYNSIYVLIKKNKKSILIAPLWIIRHSFKLINKKGTYFLGRSSWSDYLNFIYSEFDGSAVEFLIDSIREKYSVKRFFFESLKQDSSSFAFLRQKEKSRELGIGISVAFSLPKSQEDYQKILSKNTRQNIRTAHNRQKRDGITIRVNFDDKEVDKDKCWEIREERFHAKFQKTPLLKKIKYAIMRKLAFQFSSFLPFYTFDGGHFLTTYDKDILCSFFYYIFDKDHKLIIILAAGVNSTYSKYSPGFLSLFDLINNHIEKGDVNVVDFGVGDEKYKYSLGGQLQSINGIELNI